MKPLSLVTCGLVFLVSPALAAEEPKERASFKAHTGPALCLAFSSGGKMVATGSGRLDQYGEVKLWDLATGKALRTIKGHEDYIYSLAFTSDGKRLATGSGDKTIKLWAVESGKELMTLKGHKEPIRSVACSANGKLLASGSDDGKIKLWDMATGQERATLKAHDGGVTAVAFAAEDGMLLSGGKDKLIKIWEPATGKERLACKGHTDVVHCLAVSVDGKFCASGSSDKSVRLWDLATGKEKGLPKKIKEHDKVVLAVALTVLDAVPAFLASGTGDFQNLLKPGVIKFWDLRENKESGSLKGPRMAVWALAFSPDARILAAASNDGMVRLWDLPGDKGGR